MTAGTTAGTAPKTAPKGLTLRDTNDLLAWLDQWIDDHRDEVYLAGGALPDELAALLDEIGAAQDDRVAAIKAKLAQFQANADMNKALAASYEQRAKVFANAHKALKAYAYRETERAGGRIETPRGTFRLQRNSAPAVETSYDAQQLLAIYDTAGTPHPLVDFLTLERTAKLDTKALAAAYEAREAALEAEAAQLFQTRDDLTPEDAADLDAAIDRWAASDDQPAPGDAAIAVARRAAVEEKLAEYRRTYVAHTLAEEFPGVTVTRGAHVRIA